MCTIEYYSAVRKKEILWWQHEGTLRDQSRQDGGIEGCALTFSWENSKITTCCWTTIDRRMLDPINKRYPMSKNKGEAPETIGEMKLHWKSDPLTHQRSLEGSNKTLCAPWDSTETEPDLFWVFECLLWRYGSTVAWCRGRSSGWSRSGCGISPLGGGHH